VTVLNYEWRLACLVGEGIAPCHVPLPDDWQTKFSIGDRVQMPPTRFASAHYSPIPARLNGIVTGIHSFNTGWDDPDGRETRPIEVEWSVADLAVALSDWFDINTLRVAIAAGYAMPLEKILTTIRWWMHPDHINLIDRATPIRVAPVGKIISMAEVREWSYQDSKSNKEKKQ